MKRRTFISSVVAGVGAVAVAGVPLYAQERKYLNQDQALKLVFPKSERIVAEDHQLNDVQATAVQQALRVQLSKRNFTIHRGITGGGTDGYALIADEIGKDQFITFIVGITPDFRVQRVALMVFRESRGWEVEDARFTNQFRGKTSRDRLLVSADITGITGATLSSRAFCRGTKKALVLCETFYKR